MRGKKIEDLTPNHETVMGCLQLALKNLDNANISDTAKISRTRHNIRDALFCIRGNWQRFGWLGQITPCSLQQGQQLLAGLSVCEDNRFLCRVAGPEWIQVPSENPIRIAQRFKPICTSGTCCKGEAHRYNKVPCQRCSNNVLFVIHINIDYADKQLRNSTSLFSYNTKADWIIQEAYFSQKEISHNGLGSKSLWSPKQVFIASIRPINKRYWRKSDLPASGWLRRINRSATHGCPSTLTPFRIPVFWSKFRL